MSIEAMKQALEALEVAQDNLRPHGDNCFLHDEGEYNRCFCGKDSLSNYLQESVEKLDAAIKQARSSPEEPVYHLRQFGDVTKEQLDRYMATGDINPQPAPVQEPPPECQTEAEKRAYAFGWWKAMEYVRKNGVIT